MGRFTAEGDLRGSAFVRADLSGARFRDAGLAGVRMRGVDLSGADVDGMIAGLRILGVEVAPLIAAELDRRHPERAIFSATEPDAVRAGWADLGAMWTATVERVQAMPPGTADVSVDGEFSFAQTLRHLVFGTDGWLGQAIRHEERPFHPLGVVFWEAHGYEDHFGLIAPDAVVPFAEVLAVRAERQTMVREFLAGVTTEHLATVCGSTAWDDAPDADVMTVLDCLRVIFDEEWNHHRYAVRDLGVIDAAG